MAAAAILLAATVTPALADHDDDDHRDRHERRHSRHFWHKQARMQQSDRNVTTTVYPSDWSGQRVYFSNNWGHRNPSYAAAQSAALELEMKNSWNAFHKNSYSGPYDWNVYNNPEFFDYVHTNNPSLFTQVRSYISN